MLKTLAWVYTAGFVGIFLITHTPGLTDARGYLFGLFKIDPIDDIVHLLSGIAGGVVAIGAPGSIRTYLQWIGILYGLARWSASRRDEGSWISASSRRAWARPISA